MKFAAFVLLALSAASLRSGACEAQQVAQPPVQEATPLTAVPVPTSPPSPVIAIPPGTDRLAPAPAHHTRSLQKAAPSGAAPAPAAASKPNSGTPDVVVGGLPGEQSATADEKQP